MMRLKNITSIKVFFIFYLLSFMFNFNSFEIYNNYYVVLFHFCVLVFLFFSILFIVAVSFSFKRVEFEKLTPYECGFEPFETNTIFNIHFYIVGLSFLVFDLEVIFLYPWLLFAGSSSYISFLVFCMFVLIIVLGFIYE